MAGKSKFLWNRLRDMDFGRMFRRAKEVGKRYHKNSFLILTDMIYCGIRYQAGYEDYVLFDFAELTAKQRATYVTRGYDDMLVRVYNHPDYRHILKNKIEFFELFRDYIHRSWIDVSNTSFKEFAAWVGNKNDFMIKPLAGSCGRGVMKLTVSDFSDVRAIYDYILQDQSVLAEERVIQHEAMARIYPGAINTIRIVSLYNQECDHVYFPFIAVRIGNGGVVDNINSGGMTSIVDPKTGVIRFPASDKNFVRYETHPITGTVFQGFQIPMWEQCLELVSRAVRVLPQVGYVGWDVAVSTDGPILLEANDYPGHDIYQMPGMVPDKVGMLPTFQKIVDEKNACRAAKKID
ncbi:MAG: sugar-transfer associated ATP-grasp domain-containing protein [Anaerofustis sp.]